MSFETRGEAVVGVHDEAELRLVYRELHSRLTACPALLDTHFLLELQNFLQDRARGDGVDVRDHSAWERWLAFGRPAKQGD